MSLGWHYLHKLNGGLNDPGFDLREHSHQIKREFMNRLGRDTKHWAK